jgi:hypothetical protein
MITMSVLKLFLIFSFALYLWISHVRLLVVLPDVVYDSSPGVNMNVSKRTIRMSIKLILIASILSSCTLPQAYNMDLSFHSYTAGDLFLGASHSVDVFVIAGQSNGVGAGDPKLAPMNGDYAFMSFDSQNGGWKPQSMVNPSMTYGSLAPAFASRYYELTGRTAAFVQTSIGGTALSAVPNNGLPNWGSEGSLRTRALGILHAGLETLIGNGITYTVKGIIWVQGESDAIFIPQGLESAAEYEAGLRGLIAFFKQNLGDTTIFGIVRTGTFVGSDDTGFAMVRTIQDKVATDTTGAPMLYQDTVNFPAKGWMTDTIHYSQTGLNDIGYISATFFHSE